MHRVSKTNVASRGIPIQWEALPESGDTFPNIQAIIRYMLVCLIINYKKRNITNVVSPSLNYSMHVLNILLKTDQQFLTRMKVFLKANTPTAEMIRVHLQGIIRGLIERNGIHYKFGVFIHDNFAEDCKFFHTNTDEFRIFFDSVWNEMFPLFEIQKLEADAFFAKERNEVRFKSVGLTHTTRSPSAIVAQNSVTVKPFVPARLVRPLFDIPVQTVHEPVASAPVSAGNDSTELYRAVAEACLKTCVAKAVAMAAESFAAGNCSNTPTYSE